MRFVRMEFKDYQKADKYNLFVAAGDDAWISDFYVMMKNRCLTSYIVPAIKNQYGKLDDVTIENIKKYPCLFVYEDTETVKKEAFVGHITDILVRTNGVKFKYIKNGYITYDDLHRLTFELDIDMSGGITELMHTHWTIKTVNLYNELKNIVKPIKQREKVFISYCWTPKENKDKVIKLAERLENDGVNVLYDKKSLKPGQDMVAFMEALSTDETIKKVLVICNADYAKKADNREGGVGTESEIIIPQVYGHPMQNKIIPLFFEKATDGSFYKPVYLRNRYGIDFTDDFESGYKELLKDIKSTVVL